ncbi:hypothetical protein SAMN05428960_4420 [Mitsuaria sp. PDC51]|jgi:hypothetical protein|uniref:hypothetical protein n=1 Tax=unclassified Roseateles TaxID=2626991 RepID=UPI0008E4F95D|nr:MULTISPECIES: hypothetical protein [unclassified Roseateles]MBB3282017.1 hypothetical protein [Mitsuaria sp. BK037]MBB3294069.1 hypothetical protein [Mitsuaria sp. BK041]MBB3363286.1 hypothetical protein [Mitsuaria sp. BK045]SFR98664.1 hypothetical protein SAMN05428960_4420 [Mitsuaria sp. PDC51]
MNSPAGPLSPIAPLLQDPALQRHLVQCAKARGRWFGLALLAERVQGVVLPRLATTAALSAVTLGLFAHWL